MKININLFISLYRRARRDRQRNLFDLIDICNHTAHDFSIIIITFVYLSVCSIRSEKVRKRERRGKWHCDTSFRSSSFPIHSWRSFRIWEFISISDIRFNGSNDSEHHTGKWTIWPYIFLISLLRKGSEIFFLILAYVLPFLSVCTGQYISIIWSGYILD
jgi:hypothetical protein